MHLLGNTKTSGGAGYSNETIQSCAFFYNNMKKGLLEDVHKLLELASQHRQHKTWAKCAETLEKVTADARTVTASGVSFCIPAPQPVSAPAAVPSATTPFSIAASTSQQQAKDNLNLDIMQWLAEADVPPHDIKRSSFLNVLKLAKQVPDTYKLPEVMDFSGGRNGEMGRVW